MSRSINALVAGALALGGCASESKRDVKAELERVTDLLRQHESEEAETKRQYQAFLTTLKNLPLDGERKLLDAILTYLRADVIPRDGFEFEREGAHIEVKYLFPLPSRPRGLRKLGIYVTHGKIGGEGLAADIRRLTRSIGGGDEVYIDTGLNGDVYVIGGTLNRFNKVARWSAEELHNRYR